jgi:hypothetical protein
MKKALFLIIPFAALVACKGKPKQPLKTTIAAETPAQSPLLKKLAPVYQGVWVKSDYMEKIRQRRSVLAAVDLVTGITGMQIDSNATTGDSLKVAVGWDNQNPGSVMLKNKAGTRPNTLQFGQDELGYSVANGDTSLILYQVYQNKLYQTRYNKILNADANRTVSDAMSYAINKALVAGDYLLKGQAGKITFTNDGRVNGLAGFRKYFVENDLKPGPLNNLDLIIFDEFSNGKGIYSYRFKGNTLELYETTPDAKSKLMVLGKLKYTLVRQ